MMIPILLLLLLLRDSCSDVISICPHLCYCDDKNEYVTCEGSGKSGFPDNLPDSTIRLELRNFQIPELRREQLLRLPSLEEFHIQNSGLETLEEGAFVYSSRLEKLDLRRNRIQFLNGSSLTYLSGLKHLDLSSNKIESTDDAFEPLANLEQLYLKDNLLSELTTHTFSGLHKIQYLNLDSNNISSIEVGTFQYLTNLARLVISSNPLSTLSRLDFFGSRLQYIDISLAGLGRIPQTLTRFVRDLRLAGNDLSTIGAGDLDSYPYLGLLVLDDNCIKEIENDALGRLEYLVRLWLNGNCLTKIPPNLPPSLLALYLEENKLEMLPSYGFKGLLHLEQLFLQRNTIVEIQPCAFCDLVDLKSLDLQANRIADLSSGVFDNLTHLEMLDLSQNNLKWIDALCFNRLTNLATLQMSRVHTAVEMEETVFDPLMKLQILEVYDSPHLVQTLLNSTRMLHGLKNLKEFNLMHNYITELRADFPSFFPSLKVVKLSGNLWNCDEKVKWLSNWIKQSKIQFYSNYNIRCAAPESLQSKSLMMLSDSDISVADETITNSVLPTIEILTTLSSKATSFSAEIGDETSYSSEKQDKVIFTSTSRVIEPLYTQNYTSTALFLNTTAHPQPSTSEHNTPESVVTRTFTPQKDFTATTKSESVTDGALSLPMSSTTTPPHDLPNKSKRVSANNKQLPANTDKDIVNSSTQSSHQLPHSMETTTPVTKTSPTSEEDPEAKPNRAPGLFNATAFARTSSKNQQESSSRLTGRETRAYYLGLVILASAILVAVVVGFAALGALRVLRRPYHPVKRSSISYYPQTDEVSIVTLTEGTVGMRTNTHRGLGNKLYYIMEDGKVVNCEGSSRDPQLQELLPTSSPDSTRLY